MRIPHKQRIFFSPLIIAAVLIFDQSTKIWVSSGNVPFVCNTGFAFGLYQSASVLIPILVLAVVAYFFFKETRFVNKVGLALIVGGSLSNIFDRLTRGCVVDFVNLQIWPAFNLADASISAGVAILIFLIFKNLKYPEV